MSFSGNKLLIGTHNQGKVRELQGMLGSLALEVYSLAHFPQIGEVDETGTTFAENARLKAVAYAAKSGLVTLADDSGLEVTALHGRPGVQSARYGGDNSEFSQKIAMLLDEIRAADDGREARFVCSIAVASPKGDLLAQVEGVCNGMIENEPRGGHGFGYDPVFVPNMSDRTFGEMSDEEKAQISHRANAFSQIIPFLRDFYGVST
ncbi:MAG: RdgB/HAM1 family non-canonical purine NTP pyrophosphatase [Acidobacteria bacterium]|nr:RdgB/HAM1 family non-canonical purine NTP pyrophosphatase [Acidobacteriota bacterium]